MIATRAGGTPEVVEHGVTGFLAEVGDIDAMAARTVELLGDEPRVEGVPIDYLLFADWGSVVEPSDAMRRVLRGVTQGAVRTMNGVSRVVAGTAKVLLEALTSTAHAHFRPRDGERARRTRSVDAVVA